MTAQRVAVIGGGWAGLAAAVTATNAGQQVTLFEAARRWGGRACALPVAKQAANAPLLDNGQHILIGAYDHTLKLMQEVGVDPDRVLLRLPLRMVFPDGGGLRLADWPSPFDVLAGIARARGWSVADKWALLRGTAGWQLAGFRCPSQTTVAELCRGMSDTVVQTLIEPLCVAALNTPATQASGQTFLRVLKDALLGERGSSNLLLPTCDLSSLFPDAAVRWLERRGAALRLGQRVVELAFDEGWTVDQQPFDAVILAMSAPAASQFLQNCTVPGDHGLRAQAWAADAAALQHEGIATVYMQAGSVRLTEPMLALRSSAQAPAQFVFDRGQLGGPTGLLAFVVSASREERTDIQAKVLHQAHTQLAGVLQGHTLQVLQTVVEKRATFACTPALRRPQAFITKGLLACGDYVDGPYPATLEGAVRSGVAAALAVS